MANEPIANERLQRDGEVTERFLDTPNEQSFTDVFNVYTPQLVAFFRARRCEPSLAEDLAQEVMLTVHLKATQLRDRTLFRGWLFTIARNVLCRYHGKQTREVDTVDLAEIGDRLVTADNNRAAGTLAFEFLHWMAFLDSREREVMRLRFIEQWEYHEIAAAKDIPIGTVQWRVFNAKRKLAPYLTARQTDTSRAA